MPVNLKHIYTLCLSVLFFNICYGQKALKSSTQRKSPEPVKEVEPAKNMATNAMDALYSNPLYGNTIFTNFNYDILKCKGSIPADFITLSSESYKRSKKQN